MPLKKGTDPIANALGLIDRPKTRSTTRRGEPPGNAATDPATGLFEAGDDDYVDTLLDTEIAKSRREVVTYDELDGVEAAIAEASDERLLATDTLPVSYGAQTALLDEDLADDLLATDPDLPPDVAVDFPADYSRRAAPARSEEERHARYLASQNAAFVWSRQKVRAASFAALGLSVSKIAVLVGEERETVEEWHRSPFFRRRMIRIREHGPRAAWEFLEAQTLLVGRRLIAIINSGTSEHNTQLRAISLFFKLTGFGPEMFKKDDGRKNQALTNVLQILEGDARVLEDDLDPSYEWAEREVGPELVHAVAEAGKALRADDLKLLSTPVVRSEPETVQAAIAAVDDPEPPAKSPIENLQKRLDRLPAPAKPQGGQALQQQAAWAVDDALDFDSDDFLIAYGVVDPDDDADLKTLLTLRLADDEPRDDLLVAALKRSLRGKSWEPIMTLDPVIRAKVRRYQTAARHKRSPTGSIKPMSTPALIALAR